MRVPTYDVHQHLLPASLVAALRARREPPRLVGGTLELREGSFPFDERANDLGERLALLDRDGTDVAVVSLAPTLEVEEHPELQAAYHEGIGDLVRQAGGRLRALASGACLEGFAGACVSAQALAAGLGELPDELARAGQVLFVHPGPPERRPSGSPTWWAAVVGYTAQMEAAFFSWLADGAARHAGLDVVFAALAGGAPVQLERLAVRGGDPDAGTHSRVYLDTASYGGRALGLCLEALGPDCLVFGSDVPVIDSGTTLQALADLGEAAFARARSEIPGRLFP